ncbi:MAG: hypothetical protein WA705_20440 [Candidatus Ozemobacteraceae bacterium]
MGDFFSDLALRGGVSPEKSMDDVSFRGVPLDSGKLADSVPDFSPEIAVLAIAKSAFASLVGFFCEINSKKKEIARVACSCWAGV